jgi:hypothetical protein
VAETLCPRCLTVRERPWWAGTGQRLADLRCADCGGGHLRQYALPGPFWSNCPAELWAAQDHRAGVWVHGFAAGYLSEPPRYSRLLEETWLAHDTEGERAAYAAGKREGERRRLLAVEAMTRRRLTEREWIRIGKGQLLTPLRPRRAGTLPSAAQREREELAAFRPGRRRRGGGR